MNENKHEGMKSKNNHEYMENKIMRNKNQTNKQESPKKKHEEIHMNE